jgi:hypothetical protein
MAVWDWEGPPWEGRGRDLRGVIFVVVFEGMLVEVFVALVVMFGGCFVRCAFGGAWSRECEGEVLL